MSWVLLSVSSSMLSPKFITVIFFFKSMCLNISLGPLGSTVLTSANITWYVTPVVIIHVQDLSSCTGIFAIIKTYWYLYIIWLLYIKAYTSAVLYCLLYLSREVFFFFFTFWRENTDLVSHPMESVCSLKSTGITSAPLINPNKLPNPTNL